MNQSPTILIVDDTPEVLMILGDLLEFSGYNILYAESGEDAVEQMRATIPDLVLLDIRMPGLDGYATCKSLKSFAAFKDVPVLFMSTHVDTEVLAQTRAVGGSDFLIKPFKRYEVLKKVEAYLPHVSADFDHPELVSPNKVMA